jgi:hypothetical protein
MTPIVSAKLCKMLGDTRGNAMVRDLLAKLGKQDIRSPEDLKQVASALIDQGGLTRMIGHSIMVEALLRGADRK